MARVREQTLEDYLKTRYIEDLNFNREGSKFACVLSGIYKEFKGEERNEVAVFSTKGKKHKFSSNSGWNNFSPRFDKTGRKFAYLSKKGEENRLMLYDFDKDRNEEIVIDGIAEGLEWLNSDTLILLIRDKDNLLDEKKNGSDGYFFEEDARFSSLWKFVIGSGFERVTEKVQVWEFTVNDEIIAAITSPYPYEWSWYQAEVSLIDLRDNKMRKVYSKEKRQVAKPSLSPDNQNLLFLESLWSDRGVTSGDIMRVNLKTMKSENLTRGVEESFSHTLWLNSKEFYALSNKEGTFKISLFDGKNSKVVWSKYGTVRSAWSPSFSVSGENAVVSFESSKKRNEVLLIDLKLGKERTLTEVNKHLEGAKTYTTQKVSWKSYDGTEVYGIFAPAGSNSPLMVIVHGGPTGSSTDLFTGMHALFLSNGYSVFLPNYRGSTGKGREYAEKNLGDMGGEDLQDILSGIDFLVKHKGVNKRNIFITGGSYGGFMTAWAITQTNIFRGAIALFGISDWISFHGVSNLPLWDSVHYDEDPYKFEKFLKFSPLWHVENIKTPILLAHGIEDPYVPVGQFYQFFRALKDKRKDVRLLLFPREGHGFKEKKHIEKYYEEIFKWLKEKS